MDKLKKELQATLLENMDVSIIKSEVWALPMHSYDVTFSQVKRLKMDILMKMLLLAFQEADIHRALTLAEMLFVEELFIRDLIGKMERTQLIRLERTGYKLTDKGYDYLEKGIFEEDMEEGEAVVSYSPVHDAYLLEEKPSSDAEKRLLPYRYAIEGTADSGRMYELLSKEIVSSEEGDFQVVVTEIKDFKERTAELVPCIEFQLYDRKQDIFYARVWNTMAGQWDETLEKQIEGKEVVKWREAMEKQAKPKNQ